MLKKTLVPFLTALCLMQIGCNNVPDGPRTVPAEGILTLDGDPVDGAAVAFVAVSGDYSASSGTDDEGRFSLNAFEYKTGAVPGEYMAIITKNQEVTTAAPKGKANAEELQHAAEEGEEPGGEQMGVVNVMPKQYAQPNPKFTFTVPEDGVTDLKIELTSK
ncbi:MAG: hypothetical protein Aurels2KO_29970 [Aureliella sp.]